MAKKLFVGSLSWDTTDQSLNDFFTQFGTVISAKVINNRETGRSRGFGFVEMEDADADKAVAEANGKELDGRPINVSEARPQEPRQFGGGGGGGGRSFGGGGGGGRDNRGGNGGGGYNKRNNY